VNERWEEKQCNILRIDFEAASTRGSGTPSEFICKFPGE